MWMTCIGKPQAGVYTPDVTTGVMRPDVRGSINPIHQSIDGLSEFYR